MNRPAEVAEAFKCCESGDCPWSDEPQYCRCEEIVTKYARTLEAWLEKAEKGWKNATAGAEALAKERDIFAESVGKKGAEFVKALIERAALQKENAKLREKLAQFKSAFEKHYRVWDDYHPKSVVDSHAADCDFCKVFLSCD